MRGKGQEYAQAENFQRMLPADDGRPSPPRFQQRPVARHEAHRQHRQREEMRKAQDIEIDLVDRVDQLFQPVRDVLVMPGRYQVSEMTNANNRYAAAIVTVTGDCETRESRCAPPSAHQAPNTNSSCQAKGLKYQCPLG